MPSNHLILCRPLLLLPSIFPRIRVFFGESALRIRWPKFWNSSFSTSPSNEYSGLISFRMDWFALLAVQGTLKSLLQHHYSKASILRRSAFFMVQLSHPYMTTHELGGVLKELVAGAQQVLSKRKLPQLPTLSRALCSGFPSPALTLFFSSHELSGFLLASPPTSLPLPPSRGPEPSLPAKESRTTGHFCVNSLFFFLVTYRKGLFKDQNIRHKGILAAKPHS